MINYVYTDANRLQSPHKYMYTPYQGDAFMGAYFSNREMNIRRFKCQEKSQEIIAIDSHLCESSQLFLTQNCLPVAHECIKSISFFDKKPKIITSDLLLSLIDSQFSNDQDKSVKDWIDFLVQRFEVTKKLYELYHSDNLRKGEGTSENVRLYWLFSMLLMLYYFATNNIKYLSTSLKINDLICSLDDVLLMNIPNQGIFLVLSKEVDNINILFNNINGAHLVLD